MSALPHHLDSYLGKTERQKLRSTLVKLNPIPAGKDLFAQGQQTTNFFIIAKGTADVYLHGVRVRTLVAGSVCGELAAISGKPRTCTITATSSLEAFTANARVFKLFFGERVAAKRSEWQPFLGGLRLCDQPGYEDQPLCEHMDEYGLGLLADVLSSHEVASGASLGATARGAAWDGLVYFVVEGTVVDEQGRVVCVPGQAFGQLEVLQSRPALLGRRAQGRVVLAVLEADDFMRLVPAEATRPAALEETKEAPPPPPPPKLGHFADIWTTSQMLDGGGWEAELPPPPPLVDIASPRPLAAAGSCKTMLHPNGAAPHEGAAPFERARTHREAGLLVPDATVADREAKRVASYEAQLEKVPVLQGLTRVQRQRLLDALEEVSFAAGKPIVTEGKQNHHLYLVLSGRVTLSKRAEGDVGERTAGDYFGERSLQSTPPLAIASATAATACELLRMERTALDRVLGLAALKSWSNTLAGAKTARGISSSLWRSAATARVSSKSLVAASEAAAIAAAATAAAAAATAAVAAVTLAPIRESTAGGDEEPAPPFERLEDAPMLHDFTVSKRPIGAGGFGKVHCCCHKPSGRHFALKHMEKAQAVKLNAAAAVLSESATLSIVLHPFVANKFCSLQTPSHLILVLEMCTGGDFYDVLKRDGHFQPAAVKVALCHLLLALEHLHGAGIVHRDLKPENLLLDDRGHTKLTDFGFAKSVRFRTFTLCGTPAYMAPEVVLQRGHGKAVDFWALGCMLLELLHGKSPFAAPHAHASYQLTLQGTVTYPETLPPHAEELISLLLQKSLSKRLGNLKGGFQDIKDHAFCEGLDWEHPERLRVNTEPRPFDCEAHEWLPGEVVLASSAPRPDADTQALFHGF